MAVGRPTADDLAYGRRVLSRWGQVVPYRLNRREAEAYERAKELGYLVLPTRRVHLRNVWWRWCEEHGHPYVIVTPQQKHVQVHYDLLCIDAQLSSTGVVALLDLVAELVEPYWRAHPRLLRRYADWDYIGEVTGTIHLPLADADAFTARVVSLLREPGALWYSTADWDERERRQLEYRDAVRRWRKERQG